MSVKGPRSAFSGGSEPLEPLGSKDIKQAVKSGQFGAQLENLEAAANAQQSGETTAAQSQTLDGLRSIASANDLSTPTQALAAVRQSAKFMIKSRVGDKYQDNRTVSDLVEDLSSYIAADPFLQRKLLKILQRLKEK